MFGAPRQGPAGDDTDQKDGGLSDIDEGRRERADGEPDFVFFHFNDVYHIKSSKRKDPVGGAARFKTLLDQERARYPKDEQLTVFSGDCFAPSIMSTITKGAHMPPVMNTLGIDVAMYGNHDLDYGLDNLVGLKDETNFPWLMSNVIDVGKKAPIAEGITSLVKEVSGFKVGFFALGEPGWIDALAPAVVPEEGLECEDPVEAAKRFSRELREQGADFVVAISHMRMPNDERVAREVPGVDIVLGGHDHFYKIHFVSGIPVLNSGCDFCYFTEVQVFLPDRAPEDAHVGKRLAWRWVQQQVVQAVPEDPELATLVNSLTKDMEKAMERTKAVILTDFDVVASSVRTAEATVCNFITDILRRTYQTDLAFLPGGTFRSNTVIEAGPFKMRDIMNILPHEDCCVTLELKGDVIFKMVEHGVSRYPAHDGRFPHFSGLRYTFDGAREPGNRVVNVAVGRERKKEPGMDFEPLDLEKTYTLTTRGYIAGGTEHGAVTLAGDGYSMLIGAKPIVDEENGMLMATAVRNWLSMIKSVNMMHSGRHQRSKSGSNFNHTRRVSVLAREVLARFLALMAKTDVDKEIAAAKANKIRIAPAVDGRIQILNPYVPED